VPEVNTIKCAQRRHGPRIDRCRVILSMYVHGITGYGQNAWQVCANQGSDADRRPLPPRG
jgi:hypothetical protein